MQAFAAANVHPLAMAVPADPTAATVVVHGGAPPITAEQVTTVTASVGIAGVPHGLGNAHDASAAAGTGIQLPRSNTECAPPCAEDCDGIGDDVCEGGTALPATGT